MKNVLIIGLAFVSTLTTAQINDSITLKVDYGVQSEELQEFFSFENIDFFKIKLYSKTFKNRSIVLLAKEYWNKKLTKIDTVTVITRADRKRLNSDTLNINVIAKKVNLDSLKIAFHFKGLYTTTRKYKTTKSNDYSTRNLSNSLETKIDISKAFALLVYSLPYVNPKYPDMLFYCELTKQGIPPEQWGVHFNVEHYIIFEMKVIDLK